MKSLALVILILLSHGMAQSQAPGDSSARFVFLPAGLHFAPLRASTGEPRIGVFKFLDAAEMKVDLGNTIDIFGLNFPHARLSAGIDFFAYAFVTGAQGLRLQIDAIDGFFGGNVTFSREMCADATNRVYLRLRILHQSAHLVDGHYLASTRSWIDNRDPIPFTRDFGELVGAHAFSNEAISVRYYGGISYSTLVRPTDVQRFAYLAGVETYKKLGTLFQQPANLTLSYNITLNGTPEYAASHQLQLGIKFGEWYGKGPSIYLGYYTGRHMFAEYFDERMTTFGAGFTVDFF